MLLLNAVYTAAFDKTPGNWPTFTVDTNGAVGLKEKKRKEKKNVARTALVLEGPVLESQPRDRLSDSGVRGSNQ